VPFEILDLTIVPLRCLLAREGTKIAALACARVLFTGVEPVFATGDFADHR
jgi:hypothetical protein